VLPETTGPDGLVFTDTPGKDAPVAQGRPGIGVWMAFVAATGMALCFLLVSLCRPYSLAPSSPYSDLPRPLRRFGPVLTAQGFALMIGLLLIAMGRT
jgi:hypothetical protein